MFSHIFSSFNNYYTIVCSVFGCQKVRILKILFFIVIFSLSNTDFLFGEADSKTSFNEDALVILGPNTNIEEQIIYLDQTWPYNLAVEIVEVLEEPKCNSKNLRIYCDVAVKPKEILYLKWLSSNNASPTYDFKLHYWYKKGEPRFKVEKDSMLIVFLAPTHFNGVFSPTIIIKASDANTNILRKELSEYFQ